MHTEKWNDETVGGFGRGVRGGRLETYDGAEEGSQSDE